MLETDDGLSLSPSFLDQRQKSQSQSQNLIRSLKVSVSKIDTGYTESQSQYAKTCLAHPYRLSSQLKSPDNHSDHLYQESYCRHHVCLEKCEKHLKQKRNTKSTILRLMKTNKIVECSRA